MSERSPDLIIPVALDTNPARQQLRQFQQELLRQTAQGGAGGTSGAGGTQNPVQAAQQQANAVAQAQVQAVGKVTAAQQAASNTQKATVQATASAQTQAVAAGAQAQAQAVGASTQAQTTAIAAAAQAQTQATNTSTAAQKAAARAAATFIAQTNQQLAQKAAANAKAQAHAAAQAAKQQMAAWKEAHDAEHQWAMQEWQAKQELGERQKAMYADLKQVGIGMATAVGAATVAAMQASARSAQEAREHIKGMAEEMEHARTAAKELAALRGQDATAGFTASMAREAAGAGVDVGQYHEFSTAWEAYAGQYVGAEGATPQQLAANGQKISKDQALQLQQQVAGYAMGARGLKADESAQLLGLIMAKSRAGASNDEIMANYAKMMKVAELAPGRTSPLLGQITELGMENVGPQGDMGSVLDAATLTRVMAQRNPNEASTYGRALLRGMRQIRMSQKKMSELGIDRKMDFRQQLTAIDRAVQKHTAAGGDQGEFLSKYFDDIREWGAISTALNEGVHGGAFARAESEASTVDANTARSATARYRKGEEGAAATNRSLEIAKQRQAAEQYVELRRRQSLATQQVVDSHELEQGQGMVGATITGWNRFWGQGTREEQAIRARTSEAMAKELAGSEEGRRWIRSHVGVHSQSAAEEWYQAQAGRGRSVQARSESLAMGIASRGEAALADMANALKEINGRGRRQANPPLAAPPPQRGGGKRM